MKTWIIYNKKAEFFKLAEKYGIDPVLVRIIRNRDIIEDQDMEAFLSGNAHHFGSPYRMKDAKKAAELLFGKIRGNKKIRIIGDYDVDGVSSTAMLFSGLSKLGADVDYAIPDRISDGYGINNKLVKQANEDGIDTILTCDNGIAAAEQTEYAKGLGMTVIITDHHEIPFLTDEAGEKCYVIPQADAVVNPMQKDCEYPSKGICGTVVASKVLQILFELAGQDEQEMDAYSDLLAIATVGDVMELRGENRFLVHKGMEAMKKSCNLGLEALMEETGIDRSRLGSYHIGFIIDPCLNAGGRIGSAEVSVKLLLAKTIDEAKKTAKELSEMNRCRKEMSGQMLGMAFEMIESSSLKNDTVLVINLPECHESLAGIIAGRIKEKYYRPVIVFTSSNGCSKASGRSIEGYHMFDRLSVFKDLFEKFGGHAMAAGLSMKEKDIDRLRVGLNETHGLTKEDLIQKLYIDMLLPFSYISEELIAQFDLLEPFGNGNPRPVFAQRHVRVVRMEQKGRNKTILKFNLTDGTKQLEAVYFKEPEIFEQFIITEYGKDELRKVYAGLENQVDIGIVYYPEINEYMGRRKVQLVMQDFCAMKQE